MLPFRFNSNSEGFISNFESIISVSRVFTHFYGIDNCLKNCLYEYLKPTDIHNNSDLKQTYTTYGTIGSESDKLE